MANRFWPILLGLAYLLMPVDLVPDLFVGPGFIDDALLIGLLSWLYLRRPAATGGSRRSGGAAGAGPKTEGENQGPGRTEGKPGASRPPEDPYSVLGVDRRADFETIRKAYHRQASRYHPDKVAHLGQEFQDLAKVKFQDIQRAYETLAKQKGKA